MIKRSPTVRLRALARFTAALLAAAALAACAAGEEGRSGPSMMVAAGDPAAAEAGLEILRAGGSALDAAIATQLVLGLVEPQSSGIGGGGFLLHYDHESGLVESYDGRETAPRAAGPDLFLTPSGEPMPFREAMVGGRAVGVPGLLRMLELVHREHGRLKWSALFEPAIRLAEQGFAVSPDLAREIAEAHSLDTYPATAAYFLDAAGQPKAPGTVIVNEAYADTLRAIAIGGADAFYGGPIAQDIVAAVQNDPVNPGLLAAEDFARYEAKRRDPVCGPYRIFVLCSMGPPSSGGVAVLEMLGLLERFHMPARLPLSPETAHLFAEAMRLAFADRDRYLADPDYVAVPAAGLLNSAYLAERAALIRLTAR
ncbi:MAG TPA: gamma-glutamyltransferase, partial [Alphaproteobacteria bacterium]|nr:gamma-glutamyltransferase [Alphaproteobacteria bacterium]